MWNETELNEEIKITSIDYRAFRIKWYKIPVNQFKIQIGIVQTFKMCKCVSVDCRMWNCRWIDHQLNAPADLIQGQYYAFASYQIEYSAFGSLFLLRLLLFGSISIGIDFKYQNIWLIFDLWILANWKFELRKMNAFKSIVGLASRRSSIQTGPKCRNRKSRRKIKFVTKLDRSNGRERWRTKLNLIITSNGWPNQ